MAVSVGLIEQIIEKAAPRSWAEEWDNSGLLVGSSSHRVDKLLLALDGTTKVVEEAIREKAGIIIAHHPLMFKPLKNLNADNPSAQIPLSLLRSGISYYAAHTNLDQSVLSSSRTLAVMIGLQKTEYLAVTANEKLFKIVTFVPRDAVEKVRLSLSAEGVGAGITDGEHSDSYAECFYQTEGMGTFKALEGADPAIGEVGEVNRVEEVRLESIVQERDLSRAVRALHKTHPYEEPAYDLIPLKNTGKPRGYGAIGVLPETVRLDEFWERFLSKLPQVLPREYELSSIRLAGDPKKKIKKVAIANGSGSSFIHKGIFQGADLYITGDIDHHGVLDALEADMAVGVLGHFLSEIPMIRSLYEYLKAEKALNGVEMIISNENKTIWSK
ncbi:NGG1p interacting factor 3 protein, NIF3 [Syntrophobotulus glycolicus DSM 8271]|uniref:GTP cyclohydrolase 1 type 2 homolog n=1 Tax=Syntrophobotulus glycolicus (strain DSM 8271 / FlGlyR) TaxID=645991 RepID=F0SUW9_SYNGF|nr:Nif3-like dinuclear metal center hexameric protein [Syntrophobotulus glycolicus]ADY56685.1 NGG1p interacting factor 3 protein, NIF3 [Syntrophobotulus glycolicus DSM 8271]